MIEGKELKVLISEAELAERITALGKEISETNKGVECLTVVGVLKGSFMFLADLVRAIDLPMEVDFLGVSSYGMETKSSGVVKFTRDLSQSIQGKHVIIVEDIIDTGLTMTYLLENFKTRGPASVQVCTLLHKPCNQESELTIDFTGFTIEDHFVIGYGLDLAERYRNLPYIGYLTDKKA